MTTKNRRFVGLDAARAVAAIMVVVAHVAENWARFDHSEHFLGGAIISFSEVFKPGIIGVFVFFLISGFVVPYSVHDKNGWQKDKVAKIFLVRRTARIFPLLWFSIPLGAYTTHYIWDKQFEAYDWILNLLMVSNFLDRPFAQGLYWSLQIELVFYFLVAVLLLKFPFASIRVGLLTIAIIVFKDVFLGLDSPNKEIFRVIFTGLQLIMLGWLIRTVFFDHRRRWSDILVLGLALVYYLGYRPFMAFQTYFNQEFSVGQVHESLAILIFFLFLLPKSVPRLFVFLGGISYSIYLMHPVVMYLLYKLAGTDSGRALRESDMVISLAIVVLGTILCSWVTWKLIERPFQNLGRKFRYS